MSDHTGFEADEALIGTVIAGRYEILEHLGSGGMGSVFRARQLAMDRPVALKLLHAHYATNKQAVARFNREMQVTARVEHPNTIRVYDYGQAESGRLFLAIEFIEGRTLSSALRGGEPMGSERLVHIAIQIGKALAAAHSEGIVHRDLKPDNVMLADRYGERDFVKVLDFGIARFMDDSTKTQLTAEGAVVGTPIYMSPEQATGGAMDHRTDLYSFGVMLFEMATGQVPFDAPTTISLMVKHVQETPPRPSDLAPGLVPEPLERLILQMLAKAPGSRPASANEVVQRLEAVLAPLAHGSLAADTWAGAHGETGYASAVGEAPTRGDAGGPRSAATRAGAAPAGPAGRVAPRGAAPPAAETRSDAVSSRAPSSMRGLWFGLIALVIGGGAAAAVVLATSGGGGPSDAAADATVGAPDAGAATLAPAEPDVVEEVAAADDADAGGDAEVADSTDDAEVADGDAEVADGDAEDVDGDAAEDVAEVAPVLPGSAVRPALDAAMLRMGYPVPEEICRSSDAAVEQAFLDALLLLEGGRVGGARDSDAKAQALLDGVADRAREKAEYWVLVAQARLFGAGKASTVLDAAARAVALCERWPVAHNAVGNAHLRLDEAELAIAAYQHAAALDPAYAAPRFNIGLIKLKQNDQAGAIAAFTEVIGRSPDHPNARLLRGQAYLKTKQLDRAVADFAAEAERDSTNPRAWLLLGQARQANGEDAAARVAFCKARELGAPEARTLCPDEP